MSEKIEITFDPFRRDRSLSTEEALGELHKFYCNLVDAGFKPKEASALIAELLVRFSKESK